MQRHYGESLAALPLLPSASRSLVDVGSGAGFPGLVLAAARPDLAVTLVEARQRKSTFLATAVRHAALSCRILNARVDLPLPPGLPEEIDLVTMRALKVNPAALTALAARMPPTGRLVLWLGADTPDLPAGFEPRASLALGGSARRRILAIDRTGTPPR